MNERKKSKAVVTLSGGADSATILYLAMQQCEEVHAISINYGQSHVKELKYAEKLCEINKIKHTIVPFDLTIFGGSPLTDSTMDVPSQSAQNQSSTVVPYRNTFIALIAAAYCKANGCNIIYMGPTYEDLENYEDCRPVFFDALQQLLLVAGTVHDLEVRTPFIMTTKQQIVQVGQMLQVPYANTWTCIVDDSRNKVNRAIGESCRPSKIKVGDELLAIDEATNELVKTEVKKVIKKDSESFYLIELENGKKLRVTGDHLIYTIKGWVQAQNLNLNSVLIHSSSLEKKRKFSAKIAGDTIKRKRVKSINQSIHNGLKVVKISKVEKKVTVYDYVCFPHHNFLLNWVVVHNCYKGEEEPCMVCDACRERMESFRANDMRDPLISEDKWAEYAKEFEKHCK